MWQVSQSAETYVQICAMYRHLSLYIITVGNINFLSAFIIQMDNYLKPVVLVIC